LQISDGLQIEEPARTRFQSAINLQSELCNLQSHVVIARLR
jgi:hypothetical protein